MSGTDTTPNLQSILASLARYATLPPSESAQNGQRDAIAPVTHHDLTNPESSFPTTQPPGEKVDDPRLRPQSCSTTSPKPLIDPATITTWQEGVRCVTKIAQQNAQFAASIRRMIEDQRKHEMRWYAERLGLKQKQAGRASSTAQAQSILQSLRSATNTTALSAGTATDPAIELASFDRKIYIAQEEMQAALTSELKALGVPFFGTDRSLVVPAGVSEPPPSNRPKWSPLVTEVQLLELRRRMVSHLEDLYRD